MWEADWMSDGAKHTVIRPAPKMSCAHMCYLGFSYGTALLCYAL